MSENGDEYGFSEEVQEEKESTDVRRDFNPMVTWVYMAAAIAIVYVSGFIGGWIFMIMTLMFLMVWLIREAAYLLRVLVTRFPRYAAYINVLHAGAWFVLFLINAYTTEQLGNPLLFPEVSNLTMLAPLFVCTGVFGITNIRLMYAPAPND